MLILDPPQLSPADALELFLYSPAGGKHGGARPESPEPRSLPARVRKLLVDALTVHLHDPREKRLGEAQSVSVRTIQEALGHHRLYHAEVYAHGTNQMTHDATARIALSWRAAKKANLPGLTQPG